MLAADSNPSSVTPTPTGYPHSSHYVGPTVMLERLIAGKRSMNFTLRLRCASAPDGPGRAPVAGATRPWRLWNRPQTPRTPPGPLPGPGHLTRPGHTSSRSAGRYFETPAASSRPDGPGGPLTGPAWPPCPAAATTMLRTFPTHG